VVTEGEPRRSHRRSRRLHDFADDSTIGEHVEVVIVRRAGGMTLLNLLWIVFGGLWMAIGWVIGDRERICIDDPTASVCHR
jgi:hypothetical protein